MGRDEARKSITAQIKAKVWASNAKKLRGISSRSVPKKSLKQEADHKPCKKFAQGWREIDGKRIYFRSRWECNYGFYLQWQKDRKMIKEWYHEPKTFWFEGIKRGCVTYLPDFQVINNDGSHEWIEVKGFMDAKSRTKINRFRKYFPEEKLRIVNSKWYKANKKKLSLIIPGWER